jgi:hypothetical protein
MNEAALTWSKIYWDDFQKLSLFLYREQTNDDAAEEFLKHGHFQSGIDLFSFQQASGKYVCIQCKHSNLTFSKLKKIIPLFLVGEFGEITETFIIITSADLQEPKIQKWVTEQKIALREHHAIAFDLWDRNRLEDTLVGQFRLVEKYFGLTAAIDHCFQPALTTPSLEQIPDFIKRNIQPVSAVEDTDLRTESKARSSLTLTELLKLAVDQKDFCLIAEAYEGKSSLFRQTAWELSQLDLRLVPLLLDLKLCSILPITELLSNHFSSWMSVPTKDLVILIDGLDEVAAEHFYTVVGHIRDFKRNHPAVRLAFSCRKTFFAYQNLEKELPGFGFYELIDLHLRQIFDYLENRVGGYDNAMKFYTQMNSLGLANLLDTPFYLIQLVKWFNDPTQDIPKTKIAIATRFVDESLDVSATRKLRIGLSLDKFKSKYRLVLQQLALLLQIKGLNACHDELLQELFKQDDIDLLAHSSILNVRNGQWSFINAIFQEQLAALALQKLEADIVINLVTLGDKIRKISRKWIQTLATYLSLLPEEDIDRQKLVTVIEADNIELLAISEGSKFSNTFRLEVLQKILNRCNRYQARLVSIDESNLASFSGNADLVVDALLAVLTHDTAVIVKVVACRTLRYLSLTTLQADRYSTLAKQLLVNIDNVDLGRLLLEAIAHYKLGDEIFLQTFLPSPLLQTSHELRQGLYQYLTAHALVDRYFEVFLSGFDVLYAYNTGTSHYGSEKRLMDAVLTTRNDDSLRQLLNIVQGNPFQKFFRYDKDGTKAFYKGLAKSCADVFKANPSIIFPVVSFLCKTGRHDYDREPNEMAEFLELTSTHSLGFRIAVLLEKEDLQKYAYSGALTHDCINDICYGVEEGDLDRPKFNICVNGLYYSGHQKVAEDLEELAARIFGFSNQPSTQAVSYRNIQERKRKNDLLYIGSNEAFRTGINELFNIAGKDTIGVNELFERFDEDNPLIEFNSTLLTSFIIDQADERVATLVDCMEALNNNLYFKVWRANKLQESQVIQYYPELVKGYLKTYYDEEVVLFPFESLQVDSEHNLQYQAKQLLKIWAQYEFPTDDELLLKFIRVDTEGYKALQSAEMNKRKSVIALLLKHFKGRENLLKKQVLNNLQNGLKSTAVIGTHMEFCRELRIIEARSFILNLILGRVAQPQYGDDFMTLYVDLGGPHADLLPVFKSLEDLDSYLFMFMVKLLGQTHGDIVIERLLECLRSETTQPERKLEAARYLAHFGNQEGFTFMLNTLKAGEQAPFDIQSKLEVWNIDTGWALVKIRPLLFIILDEATEKLRFHDSPKHILLEILNGLAAKSENDLEMVTGFMKSGVIDLASDYSKTSGHLAWLAEQMNERYREINVIPLSNREIKSLFRQISE